MRVQQKCQKMSKTSKNSLFHKSDEKIGKNVKKNFLRTLQITQMFTRKWKVFLQEEQLSIIKKNLWHFTCHPLPSRSDLGWKSAAWCTPEESWSSFNASFPKSCPYSPGMALPWKTHLKVCLQYLIWLKTHSEQKNSFPRFFSFQNAFQ